MSLFFSGLDTSGTIKRLKAEQDELSRLGQQTAGRVATQTNQQGGDTRSDFLQAPGAEATSVGVDGDAARGQGSGGLDPGSDTGRTAGTGPVVDNTTDVGDRTETQPTGRPRLPGESPLGTGDNVPVGDPMDVPQGDLPVDPNPSTPPPDSGLVKLPQPPNDPFGDTTGGQNPGDGTSGGDGELPDGQISGLSQLAELLVHRLNQPDPFSDEEIAQLRQAMNDEFDAELQGRFRQEDTAAARRGAFFSTIPVAGRQKAVADISRGRQTADAQLLDRIVSAREGRSTNTINQALQFLGMAQNEEQARQQLSLAALQLAELGGIDPNSILALLMGEGAGPGGPTGSEWDALMGVLGGLIEAPAGG